MSAVDLAVALTVAGRPSFVPPDDFRGPLPSVERTALAMWQRVELAELLGEAPPGVALPWREFYTLAVELGDRVAPALLFFGGPR